MTAFVFRTINVDGQEIRTAVRPGSPRLTPLIVFNGIGASLDLMIPFVEELDPDQEVIAFDVPGVGQSPAPIMPYRFSGLAGTVAKMLDVLGYDQVNVIGISWGGFLAQQFAHDFPHRCSRLILAATSAGVLSVPPSAKVLRLMASPRRYTDPVYGSSIAPDIYGGSFRNNPALCAAHFGKMKPVGGKGYNYQMLAVYCWTSLHWLHRIKQPTLVLAGDDDPIIPLINMRVLAKQIPNSTLHVINDGHLFLVTQAATVAPLVTAFLSESAPIKSEESNMKFQVVDRSVAARAEHAVLTECGKHVDSYRTAEEAKARAAWLEAEYERMSEIL